MFLEFGLVHFQYCFKLLGIWESVFGNLTVYLVGCRLCFWNLVWSTLNIVANYPVLGKVYFVLDTVYLVGWRRCFWNLVWSTLNIVACKLPAFQTISMASCDGHYMVLQQHIQAPF